MQERILTVYHNVTKALILPDSQQQPCASFNLAIGTANNLYKLNTSLQTPQAKTNTAIINAWLDRIKRSLFYVNDLLDRLDTTPDPDKFSPVKINVRLYQNNLLGQYLVYLVEQFDTLVLVLFQHAGKRLTKDQSVKWLIFFSDQVQNIFNYPYQTHQYVEDSLRKSPQDRA